MHSWTSGDNNCRHGHLCHCRTYAQRRDERTNSELKECFLPEKFYSRGQREVFQIELAILMLDIKKIAARLSVESEAKEAWKMA